MKQYFEEFKRYLRNLYYPFKRWYLRFRNKVKSTLHICNHPQAPHFPSRIVHVGKCLHESYCMDCGETMNRSVLAYPLMKETGQL